MAGIAWWGVLAWLALSAPVPRRIPAALAAAFVGGVYSLAELGGSQALRSMLVGGNVFCGRAGDKVTGGMIGIAADPSVAVTR